MTILFSFSRLEGLLTRVFPYKQYDVPAQALLGPGLYFGVLIFNLAVTFYIGEWILGACGVVLVLSLVWLLDRKIRKPENFIL